MWSTIANLKENLNKIALDVHDDDEGEFGIYNSPDPNGSHVADRRISHSFAHSSPASHSSRVNGFDSPHSREIEQYKAEIKRLQESEAEIKALSVNYAALLKEKEEWILRLNEEKDLLKQNLDATNAALSASRSESSKTSTSGLNGPKGSSDQSLNRKHKAIGKNRTMGNQSNNGFDSKQDELCTGTAQLMQSNDLVDLLEEKNRSLAAMQASHESQIKKMGLELEKERDKLANIQLQLQEEQKLNGSFQKELSLLKVDKDKTTTEMNKIRDELNKNLLEIRRLQIELNRRENADADDIVEDLKRAISVLEQENNNLKMEKVELEAALYTASNSSAHNISESQDAQENSNKKSSILNENVQSLPNFPGKEEMEFSLRKLEKDLKLACQHRDRALQELNRLKQHLLEKESEESEKMDEDSKIIEELQEKNEYQRNQILHLEKALKQALASQEEVKTTNNSELQKYKETIDDLNRKLTNCTSTIDAKNVELLNLQTALGQYYAEIEAKERLEGDLAQAREETAKLAELLKDAYQQGEILKREKDNILERLSQAERALAEGRNRVNKLEEDNAKLRRALEQSMSRINRMSMDTDNLVDRRIVIKLLVTYFQRNHSKEVLDLMVRMLGFSVEDKQRIGVAQQGAGKGVVRGVLGLPGRLVGGIVGGSPTKTNANALSGNQSIADLWVDFLLKETEERERRESAEAMNASGGDLPNASAEGAGTGSPGFNQRTYAAGSPSISRVSPSLNQNSSPPSSRVNMIQPEYSDSEFSTVPLNSSEHTFRVSKILPRY